jgi:LmbE family N-acetylglucosaminyl deacetylase
VADSSRRTLLAVHAHPDDETITMGGTLARYSAEGVRTVVVTCTTGDLAGSATIRDAELRAACRVLGVSRVVQLGYADSGMPGDPLNQRAGAFWSADLDASATHLLSVIAEEQPQVIVTYDPTGGYGHPDHIKAHLVTLEAHRRLPESQRPDRLFLIRFPLTWSRAFVSELRAAGIEAPGSAATGADAGPDIHEIGVDDGLVTTRVEVRDFIHTKRSALACYQSQLPPHHFLSRMPDGLAARLWAREFYSLEPAARNAPAEDLFAGLRAPAADAV